MKAAVLKGPRQLIYQDVPKPIIKPGEVLVEVKACGICGSDLRYFEGESPWAEHTLGSKQVNPDNIILGHEFAGDVVEVANEEHKHLLGKKVGVLVYNTCGVCEFCRTGRENICPNTTHIGHGAGWKDVEYYPGGMANYCQVWATHVFPFEKISYEEASTLDFFAVAMHAVKLAPDLLGEDVAIMGSGPVGLALAQIVRLFGANKVFCIDIYDKALEIAKSLGADYGINTNEQDAKEFIMEKTKGRGVKAVFDSVGEVVSQRTAIEILGETGTLVNLVANPDEIPYKLLELSGERSIRCSSNNPFLDYPLVLELMESGKLNAKKLITHRYKLSELNKAFDVLFERQKNKAMKVILEP